MNSTLYYIKKKILWTIPILIGITFLAFSLGLMGKGDPATTRASADPNYIPTEEEIEEMHQILIKMDEIENPKESGKLDMQFHNKLIEASHNRIIVLYTSMIAELINQFIADFRVRIMANQRQADALRRAHWNIYDSLVAKDFAAGSFAMQRHFDIVGEQLERLQQ